MAKTHADRMADNRLRAASLLMELCDEAGVSRSPSEVRYKLASALGGACSQSTIRRLIDALAEAQR